MKRLEDPNCRAVEAVTAGLASVLRPSLDENRAPAPARQQGRRQRAGRPAPDNQRIGPLDHHAMSVAVSMARRCESRLSSQARESNLWG